MCKEENEKNSIEQEQDWHDLFLRAMADCDNSRKRYEKMISESTRVGMYNSVEKIICPIYNDVYLGVLNGIEGCDIILKSSKQNLKKEGILTIGDSIKGSVFNEDFMDAVSIVQTDDESKDGVVYGLIGYGFQDSISNRVIVPAKVSVYKYQPKEF